MQRIDNILKVYEKNGFVISERENYKHKQRAEVYNAIIEQEIENRIGFITIGAIMKGASQSFTKDNGSV